MLSSSQCPTSTLCYQSNYKVALDKLTVAETGQTDHFAPQQNWTVDVFDRNQKSPNKNGLKFCSGYDTTNQQCLSTGSVAGMTGPIYLLTENADSGFYNDTPDAPQDNPKGDAKSDPGLRFHDSGKCGTGVDLDMCERIKTISVTVNNAPAVSIDTPPVTSPINCDDGACKVHFGQ